LRGFTSLCEGQSPQAILGLLNEYFSALTAAIEAQGGVVDKYIGDAVMALFGAPVARSDAPAGAIRAALAMYEALEQLNATFVARGRHPVSIGVGINTDKVVAGNMGSRSRLNYTVIGDGVNLASRLEGLTKRYGANIIVSEACCKAAPQFLYLELDQVRVKGRQEPVRIFEPLCAVADASDELAELPDRFQNFLQAYRTGTFSTALSLLDIYSETPGGQRNPVLVNLYRNRLQQLAGAPPLHWDGVHTFMDK
jgi:adenylate cyclase